MLRDTSWYPFLLCIGILSIFVGSFGGLIQRKLKTLFAYSSINNMGYLLLILCFKSNETYAAFFFYIIIYIISGLCMWSIFLFLRLKQKSNRLKYNKELADLALLKKSNNPIAFALSLTMFSIAGIPPLIGFIAKFNIFYALITYEMYLESLFILLCSVISTFYYIRIIKVLYFENLLVGKLYYPITSGKTLILSSLVLLLIFLFIYPNILNLISLLFASLAKYEFHSVWNVSSFSFSINDYPNYSRHEVSAEELVHFFQEHGSRESIQSLIDQGLVVYVEEDIFITYVKFNNLFFKI
jgi:NADH-quinone oxidoreductase subunit N